MFFIIIFTLCFVLSLYTALRLSARIKTALFYKAICGTLIFFTGICFPLPLLWRSIKWEYPALFILSQYFNLSAGFLSTLCFSLLIVDALFIASFIMRKVLLFQRGGIRHKSNSSNEIYNVKRREFMIDAVGGGVLAFSAAMTGYGAYQALRTPDIKRVLVPVARLPKALDGFKIVQLTDLHITSPHQKSWLESVVEQANRLKPDIIALTGDLADGPAGRLQDTVFALSRLLSRYGKFFVTGNHEYYSGVNAWIALVERLGFSVLLNEHVIIRHDNRRILIGGVTDFRAGRHSKDHISDPKLAMKSAQNADFSLLLAHQPKSIFDAVRAGFDLQISGHTHGGQFVPWKYLVALEQPFLSGLHKLNDTQIYVSRGTGYWGPPVRWGAPSEISEIILTSA